MNFTLGLLGGLLLIFPGLVALMAWHVQSGRDGVRRSDVPLTSLVAIVLVLTVSLVAHFLGWALAELAQAAMQEVYALTGTAHPVLENPYALAVRLAEKRTTGHELEGIVAFLALVSLEAALAAAVVSSRGLTLAMGDFDAGNQGWIFQNIILPTRHGTRPIAFILTTISSGEVGLAYRGVVVETRQGSDGELKGITLASPETFIYSVRKPNRSTDEPQVRLSASRSLEGVLALEASVIRNILIQQIPDVLIDEILEEEEEEEEDSQASDSAILALEALPNA